MVHCGTPSAQLKRMKDNWLEPNIGYSISYMSPPAPPVPGYGGMTMCTQLGAVTGVLALSIAPGLWPSLGFSEDCVTCHLLGEIPFPPYKNCNILKKGKTLNKTKEQQILITGLSESFQLHVYWQMKLVKTLLGQCSILQF